MAWIGGVLACLFIFGFPATYGIVQQVLRHKEQMQEKRNEELRLQIQLAQTCNERVNGQSLLHSFDPLPKDASWSEQVQFPYEIGYQQQQIRQP